MKEMLAKYKPGASARTHMLLAASIWTVVGTALLLRGLAGLAPPERWFLLVFGIVAGTLKSLLILDRAARKNIRRIQTCKEGSCLGGVYPPKMWGLILLMILAGRGLRAYAPAMVVGLVYLAIGWALLLSSRLIWQRWRTC
jgi:hypothetical protein